jgi:archaellum biogenesis protein FlaJ (TadC family)
MPAFAAATDTAPAEPRRLASSESPGAKSMKTMLLAGLLITLPAIVVIAFFFGKTMMIPAMVSLVINFIPFVVAGFLLRGSEEDVTGH